MGALAQFPVVWMPEDDLNLKNAIEGGASLESLAKGAVQFSQRFSLQDIKNRWESILYNPVISAEVSARLMEIEHKSSNHSENIMRPKCNDKIIKTESIRDHYYAIRKRIFSENLRSMEMEIASREIYVSDHNIGVEPLSNDMLRDPALNQFDPQQPDAGLIDHCFTQVKIEDASTSRIDVSNQPFHAPHEQFYPGSSLAEQRSPPEEYPKIFNEASQPNDHLLAEKLGILKHANPCDVNGMSEDQPHGFDQDLENLLNEYDRLVPDSCASLDSLEFTSPLHDMPPWDFSLDIPDLMVHEDGNPVSQSVDAGNIMTLQEAGQPSNEFMPDTGSFDMPDPMMNANDNPASQSHNAGDTFALQDGCQVLNSVMPDNVDLDTPDAVVHANGDPASTSHNICDTLVLQDGGQASSASVPDNDALPVNSLNEVGDPTKSDSNEYYDHIFDLLDADEKTPNDNSLYENVSSMLSTSPIIADGDQKPKMALKDSDLPQSTNSNGIHSNFKISSNVIPLLSPPHNSSAACILNNEDPAVPNNDDIILDHVSSSVKELLERRNNGETASMFRKDYENLGKQKYCSKAQIGHPSGEKSYNQTSVNCKVPNNLAGPETLTSLKSANLLPDFTQRGHSELVTSRGSNHCMNIVSRPLRTDELGINRSDKLLGKAPDSQRVSYDDSSTLESLAPHQLPKIEDHVYESDDEIPYYSDIEEMVLEMDLDPVEQDIKLNEKVSKYRSSNAKRSIMRLEQAAHSFMHRAIARRGALAVIYGRNLKHYIMKSEVLLGRGTDDFQVDIDLGSEGRAQKVSRRQAVIKLESDGNFYIKNIGKRSIYKNNLEVAMGKTTILQSGSLVEIHRLSFIFEDSPICVKRHLRNLQIPAKPINAPPELR